MWTYLQPPNVIFVLVSTYTYVDVQCIAHMAANMHSHEHNTSNVLFLVGIGHSFLSKVWIFAKLSKTLNDGLYHRHCTVRNSTGYHIHFPVPNLWTFILSNHRLRINRTILKSYFAWCLSCLYSSLNKSSEKNFVFVFFFYQKINLFDLYGLGNFVSYIIMVLRSKYLFHTGWLPCCRPV